MNPAVPDDLVVRSATNRDTDRIIALVFGVLREYGLPPEPDSTDSDLNDIEGNYIRAGGVFEVLEDRQGHLLGTYGLFPLDSDTCELRKMYLVPIMRGQGLGRRMLERAVAHARQLNYKAIVLETHSVLEAAIRLYIRFGFVPIQARHISARVDQTFLLRLDQ